MSAPTSFERFGDLPVELQVMVWRHAASPEGSIRLQIGTFNPLPYKPSDEERFSWPVFHQTQAFYCPRARKDRKPAETTVLARLYLSRATCMSRQIVFEAWRSDVRRPRIDSVFDGRALSDREVEIFKRMLLYQEKIIELFDDLIE